MPLSDALLAQLEHIVRRRGDESFGSVAAAARDAGAAQGGHNGATSLSLWHGRRPFLYRLRSFHSRHTTMLEIVLVVMALLLVALPVAGFLASRDVAQPRGLQTTVERRQDRQQDGQQDGRKDGQEDERASFRWLLPLFIGPTVWITVFQLLYSTSSKRRGTASMIIGEVISIVNVYASANIIGTFVQMYVAASPHASKELEGFAAVTRKESFVTVFDKNIENLGSFSNRLIFDLTAFYTFLKSARDAVGALGLWSNDGYPQPQKRADIVDIVYLCLLQLEHGSMALQGLMETRDETVRQSFERILSGTILQACLFLLHVVDTTDFRYPALAGRLAAYRSRAERYGYAHLWHAACPVHLQESAGPAAVAALRA